MCVEQVPESLLHNSSIEKLFPGLVSVFADEAEKDIVPSSVSGSQPGQFQPPVDI